MNELRQPLITADDDDMLAALDDVDDVYLDSLDDDDYCQASRDDETAHDETTHNETTLYAETCSSYAEPDHVDQTQETEAAGTEDALAQEADPDTRDPTPASVSMQCDPAFHDSPLVVDLAEPQVPAAAQYIEPAEMGDSTQLASETRAAAADNINDSDDAKDSCVQRVDVTDDTGAQPLHQLQVYYLCTRLD